MLRIAARVIRAAGAGGAVVGCGAMAATFPAGAASAFESLGLAGSSVVGREVASVAEPVFIASAVLVIVGALACSRLVTAMAAAGGVLLYLSMFVLSTGTSAEMSHTSSTVAMGGARANTALLTSGAVLLASSFVLPRIRRRRGTCAPVFRLLAR